MGTLNEDEHAPEDGTAAALVACEEALAEMRERHLHLAADFDNHRKRERREIEKAVARERGSLLRELLEVVDDLERALQASDESAGASLREGLEAVVREARRLLERRGVRRMEAVGSAFDPTRHEAVGLAERGDAGTVESELRPGYLLDGDVLRPAEVLVGKGEQR